MSIVKSLSRLKNNIFGGPGNTGFSKPPAYRTRINMSDTPTGVLDHDPLQFGTYQYPKDLVQNGQLGHYMIFYVNVFNSTNYSYKSQNQRQVDYYKSIEAGLPGQLVNIEGEIMSTREYHKNRALNKGAQDGNLDNKGNSLLSSNRNRETRTGVGASARFKGTTRRITDSVALYLPPNVQDNLQVNYDEAPTGLLGFGLTQGLEFVEAFEGKDYKAAAEIFTAAGGQFAKEVAKRAGAAIAEGLAGAEGAEALANRIFGRASNPFMEVLFNNVGLRSFTYNFNFAPRNEEETNEVQKIIQLFRFHAAPELQRANSRYLNLPSEFDIHYMYHAEDGEAYENDYFNRISTCVLQNVAVNYTPGDKVRTFHSGAPTQITMTLTFTETEILTKEKINQGY